MKVVTKQYHSWLRETRRRYRNGTSRNYRRCCLVTAEEGCQEEAQRKEAEKKRRKERNSRERRMRHEIAQDIKEKASVHEDARSTAQ